MTKTNNMSRINSNITMTTEHSSAKGVRRSVNEIETKSMIEEENSGIILKIMDDSGRSRIEIKLGPNGLLEENKSRRYENSANKSKTDNNSNEDDDGLDEVESSVSVIKILPNNTLVLDDIDQWLVSLNVDKPKSLDYEGQDMKDLNSSISENRNTSARKNEGKYEEEVILLDKSENKPTNKSSDVLPMTDTEMYSLKMLIDNETKSLNQPVKNGNDTFENQNITLTDFNKANDYNNYTNDENIQHTLNDSQTKKTGQSS